MNYDAMGNYYGQVNDVLEQPDTSANVKPVTQTVTTDPRTGEQMMTVKGRPEDLSASNPNTPTVSQPRFNFGMKPPAAPAPAAAPVAPDQTYDRMLQAESGNRQFTPGGQVMTSPRGAMGAGQVMPATAMQPGYGVPSIFDMAQQRGMPVATRDQSTAQQLLGNEQLNRDFGQTYFNAMQQRFPGQPAAAVAAYNAGPGRVGQNMQANAGQMNPQQLPQETQGYLQKVLGAVNPIGTAQAAAPAPTLANTPLPQPNTSASLLQNRTIPQTNPFPGTPSAALPGQQQAPVQAVNPAEMPAQPAPQAQPAQSTLSMLPGVAQQPYVDEFLANQNNPEFLSKLRFDRNAPDWMRSIASSQEYDYLGNERKKQQAQQELNTAIETGDTRKIAREAAKSDDEGSWFKMLLLGYISPQLAGREADKLGLTATWQPSMLGDQQVAAKFRMDGTALEGRYTTGERAGQELSTKELKLLYGQAAGGKADYVGGSFVNDKTGQIGRLTTRNNRSMIESGGQLFPANSRDWRQNTVGTDLSLAAKKTLIDIEGKSAGEALSFVRKWNVEHPDARIPEDVNGIAQLRNIAGGSGIGGTGTQAPAATATTTTGGSTGGTTTPVAGANPTVEKAKEIARTEIVKDAAKIVADQANIIKTLESADRNVKLLDSGNVNFGSILQGQLPFEKTIANKFSTEDSTNTKDVLEYVNLIAAVNSKMLGTNPTDRDLQFVTSTKPNEDWAPQAVKEWIQRSEKAQRRTIEIARKQVESGGRYEAPLPGDTAPGTKDNPIKL
jgi:hypothetical protein